MKENDMSVIMTKTIAMFEGLGPIAMQRHSMTDTCSKYKLWLNNTPTNHVQACDLF